MKAVCDSRGGVKLIYVTINKQVSSRFYSHVGQGLSTCPVGTSIDRDCVSNDYDFYLLPCRATQGSQTPTHYNVLHDDTGKTAEEIVNLSYRLCY